MPVLSGELHPSHKLSSAQVVQIRKLWKMGYRNVSLMARQNGVSATSIIKIVNNKTWKHLNQFWGC
jgi:hypothetical protein